MIGFGETDPNYTLEIMSLKVLNYYNQPRTVRAT